MLLKRAVFFFFSFPFQPPCPRPSSASLAPLMCHGRAGLLLLSSPPPNPPPRQLSPALSEVSSLYWMVQKQNHKPISVTLAMRLDEPNLSPSGAIGSTPVSLKIPSPPDGEGAFCLVTIAIELPQHTKKRNKSCHSFKCASGSTDAAAAALEFLALGGGDDDDDAHHRRADDCKPQSNCTSSAF